MKRKPRTIKIVRTEQWEYTAVLGNKKATGFSEADAELRLLRRIVLGNSNKQPKEEWSLE